MSEPWHLGMMLGADTETSGTDVDRDRVVTACAAWVDGAGKTAPDVREWLAWPGVDIPKSATDVHGITTEHARENGLPAGQVIGEVATTLLEAALAGVPIIAFNAAFDLTLIDRETRRHCLEPLGPELEAAGALIVDPWIIDKALDPYRKGKRTLGAVAEHYGIKPEGAHSAAGDTITAARLAWMIAHRNPRIAQMEPAELMAWQVKARGDQAASFREYLRRQGKPEPVDGSWPLKPWTGES